MNDIAFGRVKPGRSRAYHFPVNALLRLWVFRLRAMLVLQGIHAQTIYWRLEGARRNQMFLTQLYISVYTRIQSFLKDKEAASAIEYAVIVAMVALVLFAMVTPMGTAIKARFNEIIEALGGTAAP
ncbi:Flp pilus assembly protein, pilin Flp [Pseudomonas syringae pv. persicae]|nr:Flp pilus assembly protein, pilin Flp [Pseudomonas syringae pv. persicae]